MYSNYICRCILFVFCTPQIFALVRAFRIFCMRKVSWAPWTYLVIVFAMETLHTSGLALLFFTVLPDLDTVRAIMLTNAVLLVPGVLSIFRPKSSVKWRKLTVIGIDVLAVIMQLVGLILWPVLNENWDNWYLENSWALPISLFLVSFGWWESFVDENSFNPVSKYLWRVKINMIEEGTRYHFMPKNSVLLMINFFSC